MSDKIEVVVIAGNPIDGFTYYGPFVSQGIAVKFAEEEDFNGDWWTAALVDPDSIVPNHHKKGDQEYIDRCFADMAPTAQVCISRTASSLDRTKGPSNNVDFHAGVIDSITRMMGFDPLDFEYREQVENLALRLNNDEVIS